MQGERRARIALGLALAGYVLLICLDASPVAGGADSSGYLNSARLLSEGRAHEEIRALGPFAPEDLPPALGVPLGFRLVDDRPGMAPTYPVGLPLHLALAALVVGWDLAPIAVLVFVALLSLLVFVLLAEELGLPRSWGVAGASALAVSPLFLEYALQPMSDLPATAWCLCAVWAAVRSRRGGAGWAVLAGLATGVAILVRPTNVLIGLPVAIAVGLRRSSWLALAAGAAPPLGFLAGYNQVVLGGPLRSGYEGISHSFSAGNFLPTLLHFAKWLLILFSPLALPLFAVVQRVRGGRPLHRWVLASWLGIFVLFYAFYYHSHETWWYLRFILPAMPALLLGALLAAQRLVPRLESRVGEARTNQVLVAIAVGLVAYGLVSSSLLGVFETRRSERVYRDVALWSREHWPEKSIAAVMQCSGSQYFYTDIPILRWDAIEPEAFEQLARALSNAGWSLYAPLFPFEVLEEGKAFAHMPGRWVELEPVGRIRIFRWAGPDTGSPGAPGRPEADGGAVGR